MKRFLQFRERAKARSLFMTVAIVASFVLSACGGSGYGSGGMGSSYSAPGMFTLTSPADLATGVTTTPALTWTTSLYATSYTVEVSLVSNFATTVTLTGATGLTTTMYTVSPALSTSALYYWRVVASNLYGTWTAGPFTFTTGP